MKTKPYSLYILSEDRTWQQPTFIISSEFELTENEIQATAEKYFGGCNSFELQEDGDCPEEYIVEIEF